MNPTLNPTKVVCLKPWRNSRWVHDGLEDLEINHGWRLETTMFSVQVPKNDQPIAIHFWMFMTTERCEGRSSQGHESELGRANMYPVNYNDLTSRPSPGIMVKGNHPHTQPFGTGEASFMTFGYRYGSNVAPKLFFFLFVTFWKQAHIMFIIAT